MKHGFEKMSSELWEVMECEGHMELFVELTCSTTQEFVVWSKNEGNPPLLLWTLPCGHSGARVSVSSV